jgi:alpha,alpha-trehalase
VGPVSFAATIREYETVWTTGRHLAPTGLSRYYNEGQGIPPEVEPGHYDYALRPYANSRGISLAEFRRQYQAGEVRVPALDQFFLHDRAMRESGHDSTYRLVNRAASLNPVALNSLLYQYETDLAALIENEFGGSLRLPDGRTSTSGQWHGRAARRRAMVDRFLWNEARGLYFDYDFETGRQIDYVSATTFFPLWSRLASDEQAAKLVATALPLLESPGGIVSSTRESRGPVGPDRPRGQWDYPFGWAPDQMIAWDGLLRYGYRADARRLAYRCPWQGALTAAFLGVYFLNARLVGERLHTAPLHAEENRWGVGGSCHSGHLMGHRAASSVAKAHIERRGETGDDISP